LIRSYILCTFRLLLDDKNEANDVEQTWKTVCRNNKDVRPELNTPLGNLDLDVRIILICV
jgi:hypothetical protein